MNIRDLFGAGAKHTPSQTSPTPAVPAGQVLPGNMQPPVTTEGQPTPGNPTVPSPQTNKPTAPESPLDKHSDLWKDSPTRQAEDNFFAVDPQKIMEAAGKVDFAKVIPPEALKAIQAGGEGAQAAFVASLQAVAQTVYGQSAMAATKITERAVENMMEKFNSQLPGLIKKHQVSDSLRTDNPAYNHPAAQPIISAMETQLSTKFPQATTSEIKAMAVEYMNDFSSAFAKAQPADPKAKKKLAETDWDTFL